MFCTKCGKQLHDEDIFCAHCGTKVREDLLQEKTERRERREEVVFNPPFRAEAERRTKQISEEFNSYNGEPKRETVHFDWNLDGFPTRETRKNEKFELNWDDVIERKRTPAPVTVEKIIPENLRNDFEENEAPENTLNTEEEIRIFEPERKTEKADKEELSIEDLERELFGEEDLGDMTDSGFTIKYNRKDLERDKDLQFNTYNAKKDAFQELLDKEKARIESMESQRKSQWEEITNNEILNNHEIKTPPKFDEIFTEPKTPLVPPLREVGVVLPPLTACVMADEAEKPEEEGVNIEELQGETIAAAVAAAEIAEEPVKEDSAAEETAAEEAVTEEVFAEEKPEEETLPPFQGESEEPKSSDEEPESSDEEPEAAKEEQEKTKLRFSDVFPADAFESGDDDDNGGNAAASDSKKEIEEDDDDEEYKGNRIIKALIVILAIIVAAELVIIGVKAIAPDSGFSKGVDSIMEKVTGFFTGEDEPESDPVDIPRSNYIEDYINTFSSGAENIGNISHDANLKYDLSKTYAFADIGQTQEFENSSWDENDESMSKTYGHSIISALISYYNEWKDRNEDSTLVGINALEIGEIRTSADGYYVLNRVTYAAADGETVVKYETAHLKTTAEDVVVDEIKEETV